MNTLWTACDKLLGDGERLTLCCQCPCCIPPPNYRNLEFDLEVTVEWNEYLDLGVSGWHGLIHFTPEDFQLRSDSRFGWNRTDAARVDGWAMLGRQPVRYENQVNSGDVSFGVSEDCQW